MLLQLETHIMNFAPATADPITLKDSDTAFESLGL
jgi:hypothetical protein